MTKPIRFALLLMFAMFAWAGLASAASIQTVVIDTTPPAVCPRPPVFLTLEIPGHQLLEARTLLQLDCRGPIVSRQVSP